MSEMPHYSPAEAPHDPDHDLTVQRVVLLSRVQTSKIWHEENLRDPQATPQEKRASRDRKREAARRLAEFDEQHQGIAPPEE